MCNKTIKADGNWVNTATNKMELTQIQDAIINGAKFNGTVYGKNNGKHWVTLHIYLDGKFTKLKEVPKEDVSSLKKEFEAALGTLDKKNNIQSTWTVDGKQVTNGLSYAEMYNRYGMDFE